MLPVLALPVLIFGLRGKDGGTEMLSPIDHENGLREEQPEPRVLAVSAQAFPL